MAPAQRLALDDLQTAAISPVVSPLPTAAALIGDALGPQPGSPPAVRRALLARLRERDVAALTPLRTAARRDGTGGRPNELVPAGTSMAEQLEAVAEVDPQALARGIEAAHSAGHPAAPWRAVARDPARWLRAYVHALRRAWEGLEPFWTRSAGVLDREVERVSVALARGAGPELIARIYPHCSLAGGELLLPSHTGAPGRVRVGDALRLHPVLAPVSACGWTDNYGDTCLAVRYAVPRAFEDAPPPASLAALVGPQRARILHRLERPATSGELAAMLHAVPSMASHHLRALERAGLIARTREGRHVRVTRSARGTELVSLYERA